MRCVASSLRFEIRSDIIRISNEITCHAPFFPFLGFLFSSFRFLTRSLVSYRIVSYCFALHRIALPLADATGGFCPSLADMERNLMLRMHAQDKNRFRAVGLSSLLLLVRQTSGRKLYRSIGGGARGDRHLLPDPQHSGHICQDFVRPG